MDFNEAKQCVMPFGVYRGKTLDKVAETDSGLKYLSWLSAQGWLHTTLKDAVLRYLSEPSITRDIDNMEDTGLS